MTNVFFYSAVFVMGLCLGSFCNVVALRDLDRKSILTGRSQCPNCKYVLRWYDLFPVFSYLFLGGKCRCCKEEISPRYPLVELVAGGLAVLVAWYGLSQQLPLWAAGAYYVAVLLFLIVSLIDIESFEVPVEYTVLAGMVGGAAAIISGQTTWQQAGLGLLIGAGSLAAVLYGWRLLFRQDGMGEGDLWIAGAIGFWLGFPAVIVALAAAVFSGAVIGTVQVLMQKKGVQTMIPFGPYLFLGALVAMVWGQALVEWYILFVWI